MSSTEMAVAKTIEVACPPDVAFRVFTEGIDEWWPARTHSIGEDQVDTVVLEAGPGGRLYERLVDGSEHEWGRVLQWEPPARLVCSWYPGRGSETAQVVEVAFTPVTDGTRVDLVHSGWEHLGDRAEDVRASYAAEAGWTAVLAEFAAAAARAS